MSKNWYALHTYSGHENKVKSYIESLIQIRSGNGLAISQVVVPTEEVVEMRGGKKTVSKKRFLPSYVLIEMEMGKDAWHLVTNIPGVTNFVGPARKPQPLIAGAKSTISSATSTDRKSHEVDDIPVQRRRPGQGQRRCVQGLHRHGTRRSFPRSGG